MIVGVLAEHGPNLRRPYVGAIEDSQYANLKELVVQSGGMAYRIAFVFDTNRIGWLLIGDVKDGTTEKAFYKRLIANAEKVIAEEKINLK